MKRIACLFLLGSLSSPAESLKTTPVPETHPKTPAVTTLDGVAESYKLPGKSLVALAEKILYKNTPQGDLYFYLLRPLNTDGKPLPAIVDFHGGSWVGGSVDMLISSSAWFRDHGMIAITVDYRLKSRHGTSPLECIEDAKSAIRYVRTHAKELGVDPGRIVASGGSAGGHIAACTVIEGGDASGEDLSISSKPNALLLHNPVLGEGFGKEFFAAHPEFSPVLNVRKGWPPTILSNGTKDNAALYETAVKFNRLMNEAGNTCELITIQDAGHSCDWPVENPHFLPAFRRMTEFLKEQKFLTEPAR